MVAIAVFLFSIYEVLTRRIYCFASEILGLEANDLKGSVSTFIGKLSMLGEDIRCL